MCGRLGVQQTKNARLAEANRAQIRGLTYYNEGELLSATVDVVAGAGFGTTVTAVDYYGVVGALHIRASEAARIATANDHGYSKE